MELQTNDRFVVRSSHGELALDAAGYVTACNSEATKDGQHLQDITNFDLLEYRKYWGEMPDQRVDILDLGYWYSGRDGIKKYCEPDNDWRQEIAKDLLKRKPKSACIMRGG